MTRRPLLSDEEFELRSQHSQVPGAKMWSESPVARLGPRRKPRTAASPSSPPQMPTYNYAQWGNPQTWQSYGDVSVDLGEDAYGLALASDIPAGGVIVAFCVGINTGWTMPNGWVTLAQGSAGDLDYALAYLVCTDAPSQSPPLDDWVFGWPDLSPGWVSPGNGDGNHMMMFWGFDPVYGAPTLGQILTGSGVTSQALASEQGVYWPYHAMVSIPSTVNIHTQSWDPTSISAWDKISYGNWSTYYPRDIAWAITDHWPSEDPPPSLSGTYNTSVPCEIVTLAWGWA